MRNARSSMVAWWMGVSALTAGCSDAPASAESSGETDDDSGGSTSGSDGSESTAVGETSDGSTGADTDNATGSSESGEVANEVEIIRDAHGVPHIRAATDEAAFYGLGYASAEDRLVQMHLALLAAQGRMSEIAGAATLDQDIKMRTWGFWTHAQEAADNLDAEHRALLDAYAEGVNAYVESNPDAKAQWKASLGFEFQPWTAAHSLAVWYRLGNFFASDPSDKAQGYEDFLEDVDRVGFDQALDDLIGDPHGGNPAAAVVKFDELPADVAQATLDYAASLGYLPGVAAGLPHVYGHESPKFSHAWAMSGSRTTTGDAVLVSDPQVPVAAPNLLYEFAIEGDSIHARGIGAAGMPGLLIGYTPDVAWGMTAAGLDQRDLFALSMVDATHYTVDGETLELETATETIQVKDGDAVEIEIRQSVWGPLVTSTLPGNPRNEYALTGIPFTEPDRDTAVAMIDMMRADDLESLQSAVEEWRFPTTNLVAALPGGDVFYTVLGALPVRSTASPAGGMIAQDGSSAAFGWLDTIPGEFKPWVVNPAEGYVMSANHRIADEWPIPLGVSLGAVGDTTRSRRLREILDGLPEQVDPRAVLDDVQFDCTNPGRRDLAEVGHHIAAVAPGSLGGPALSVLADLEPWSDNGGTMLTDAPGVGVAWQMSTKFRIQQTGPVLNGLYGGGESGLGAFLDAMNAAIENDPNFVPSAETIAYVDGVLSDAASEHSLTGKAADTWFSQNVATKTFDLFTALDAPVSVGQSYTTPAMACADGGTVWSQVGETYTQWVNLGAPDDAVTIMPPGNSEDLDGPWGTTQEAGWISGDYKAAPLSSAAIDAIAIDRTTLTIQ